MRKPILCVFFATTLLLVSCANTNRYAEPVASEAGIATLQANVPVWIIAVDGHSVSYGFTGDSKRVKLSPGPHTVTVSYKGMENRIETDPHDLRPRDKSRRFRGINYLPVNFLAKAGHHYVLNSRREEKKFLVSVADFSDLNGSDAGK